MAGGCDRRTKMECKDILNLIAIVVIPLVAVLIGQYLQNRAEIRKDKMHNINYWKRWQILLDTKIKSPGKQFKIHIFQKECHNKSMNGINLSRHTLTFY